jgi:hypothetical protein
MTILPSKHDHASWMREHRSTAFLAFTRKGCLEAPERATRPAPTGAGMARAAMLEAFGAGAGAEPLAALPIVLGSLAEHGRHLVGEGPRRRCSDAAGRELASFEVGTDTRLARAVRAALGSAPSANPALRMAW